MIKTCIILLAMIAITGCSHDKSDLELFVTTTKAQHAAYIPPLKQSPVFEHYEYQADQVRSPFLPPSRELTEEVVTPKKNCLQPDLKRQKSRLETYALDNLTMRGTLSEGKKHWALIQTSDGNVYRVGRGQYLGLYHGKIVKVSDQYIDIVELIPDGSGCWTERMSTMELTSG